MIPDGIYLNLPMQAYRDDPALGGSDHRDILLNAVQWHAKNRNAAWRELNPASEKETASTAFGTALHAAILEAETFDERYHVAISPPVGLPATKAEMASALIDLGAQAPKTSENTATFQAACAKRGVLTKAAWLERERVAAGDREVISADWRRAIQLIEHMVDAHSTARRYLSNGYPEVSVFWTTPSGVRLKCRFDYLRIRAMVDIKTYAYREGDEPIETFVQAVNRYAYDLSAAHYMDARVNAMPALIEAGRIFDASQGDPGLILCGSDVRAFMLSCAAESNPEWVWLACMTNGYPEVDIVRFPNALVQFSAAMSQVEIARETYRLFRERFGDDSENAWIAQRGDIMLTDYNFSSPRALNRGAPRWENA